MSDELPAGFTVGEGASSPASSPSPSPTASTKAPSEGTSDLPEGFTVEAPAAKEDDGIVPFLIDKTKQGITNTISLAGVPTSVVNMGLTGIDLGINKLTGAKGRHLSSDTPFGGFESTKKGADALFGVKNIPQPKNPEGGESKANEYLGTIAEFTGSSMIPGTGAVAAASRKLGTALVVMLGDISSATSAVELKQLGEEHAGSFGLTKEQGGEIGKAIGTVVGPGGAQKVGNMFLKSFNAGAGMLAKQNITGVSKDAQSAAANGLLVKEINTAMEHAPDSAANVARNIELAKKVPGWSPTLAQQTNAPGLVAMQREVANKSPEALAKASAADQRNLKAIADFKEGSFPKAAAGPQFNTKTGRTVTVDPVTDPARIKLNTNKQVLSLEVDKNASDLRALTDKYRRTADNEKIGEQLRTKYWEARATAKAVTDQKLGQVYSTANKYGIKEDMTDVRQSISKIVGSDRTTFQDMPPVFAKVLKEYPEAPQGSATQAAIPKGGTRPMYGSRPEPVKSEASFEELHSLYKQANKDWADATAAGNSSKAHYMALVRDQLKAKVDKYNGPQYGDLATEFRQFNEQYGKYAKTFREGAGGEIAKRTRNGIATDAEDIVSKVILQAGDKKKGVQDFFNVYGNDQKAADLLHDGLLDNFSKTAVKNGQYDPKAAQGWLTKHQSAMKELPELAAKLGDEQKLGSSLVNRQLMLRQQRKVLDRTVLAKVARSDKPEQLVQQALNDPKLMKGLLVGAVTPESKSAIARSIVDVVGQRPDAFEYIAANEKTLKPVMDQLGKGHWQNLKDLSELEQIAGRVKAPTQVELSKLQDPLEKTVGTSVKGMLSRLRNLDKPMGVSKEYLVADVGGKWLWKVRSEELARLRESAMFDPDTANLLAKLAKKPGPPTKAELLDLQALSFAAGVQATGEAAGGYGDAQERKKQREQALRGTDRLVK